MGRRKRMQDGGRRRPNKGRKLGLAVAVAALLALVGGGLFEDSSSPNTAVTDPLVDQTNKPAPGFSLPELLVPDRSISLADLRGKPVVINFWASWCPACRTEMPLLESAYRSEHGSVQFLGIDTNDRRSAAVGFVARAHVTYPLVLLTDPTGRVATAYGLIGLPITVFVSRGGSVVGRHIGQLNAATLKAALRDAFGAQGPA